MAARFFYQRLEHFSFSYYYVANLSENGSWLVSKVEPNILKRLIEIHKGHGPNIMRVFESIFGISLILTTLSGIWLAFTVKAYRKVTVISFAVGLGVVVLCMF